MENTPTTARGERKITETEIVTQICQFFVYKGYFFWRENNIPVYGRSLPKYTPKGLPDIFCLRDGILFGIEVKRPGGNDGEREPNGRAVRKGKLSPFQAQFGLKMTIHGGEYIIAHSLEELRTEMDEVFIRRDAKVYGKENRS